MAIRLANTKFALDKEGNKDDINTEENDLDFYQKKEVELSARRADRQ